MSNLFIVPIEPIETRYSLHWHKYLPDQIRGSTSFDEVIQIEVSAEAPKNSDGGFFNFTFTCDYKAQQLSEIAKMIALGGVKSGDVFFYTDYWNPTVHMLRYMLDLHGIDCKIVGFAHAGYWDPADILHQSLDNDSWAKSLETSLDAAYDEIYFSTWFARDLYIKNVNLVPHRNADHLIVTGFPMEYYDDVMPCYWDLEHPPEKENIIVFPHRVSMEKNYDLFNLIAERIPEYKFVVAMEVCKSKQDYHDLLYRSKIAFSAALQETGGISMCLEAFRAGCYVVAPDRLSYAEILEDWGGLYPGDVADHVVNNRLNPDIDYLEEYIRRVIGFVDRRESLIRKQHDVNYRDYFNGKKLYQCLEEV